MSSTTTMPKHSEEGTLEKYAHHCKKNTLDILDKLDKKVPLKDINQYTCNIGRSNGYDIQIATIRAFGLIVEPGMAKGKDSAIMKMTIKKLEFETINKAVYEWYIQQRVMRCQSGVWN